MTPGLVSVIVPTRSRAALLPESIASAQLQSHGLIEIIVVDDASMDGTEELVRRLSGSDGRIRFFRLQRHSGAPAARNLALRESQGEFVQFLDSDDVIHPEKLRIQTELLRGDPEADLAVCQTGLFRRRPGDMAIIWNRLEGDPLLRFLRHDLPWVTVGPLWRKTALDRFGGHDESLPSSQDFEHAVRALILGAKPVLHRHLLAFYRLHGTPSIGSETASMREEVHFKVFSGFRDLLIRQKKLSDAFRDELVQDFLWTAERAARTGKASLAAELMESALRLDPSIKDRASIEVLLELLARPGEQLNAAALGLFAGLSVDRKVRDGWWGQLTLEDEPVLPIPAARRYGRR